MHVLPLVPSIPSYRRTTTIDGAPYHLDLRWNARDAAWFLDILEIDGTPIARGVKVVLGTYLARYTDHPLTRQGVLIAIDTSGDRRDAGLDDLGARVEVRWYSQIEIVGVARALAAEGNLQPL